MYLSCCVMYTYELQLDIYAMDYYSILTIRLNRFLFECERMDLSIMEM